MRATLALCNCIALARGVISSCQSLAIKQALLLISGDNW